MSASVRVLVLLVLAVFLAAGTWWLRSRGEAPPPPSAEPPVPASPTPSSARLGTPRTAPAVVPAAPDEVTAETPGARLRVHVLDEARGTDVEGAEVTVVQARTAEIFRTDGRGSVTVPGLSAGPASVAVRRGGYVRVDVETVLAAGETTTLETRLPKGVAVEGTVLDASSGSPIHHARVLVVPGGTVDGAMEMSFGTPFGSAVTDAYGRFRVEDVEAGVLVTVRARAAGYGEGYSSVRLGRKETAGPPVEVRLSPAGSVSGTVRYPDGRPAPGAQVYVIPANAPAFLLANPGATSMSGGHVFRALVGEADERGAFTVDGLDLDAVYSLLAVLEGTGRSPVATGVTTTAEAPRVRVDLLLEQAAKLTVRVWSPDGAPQREGSVTLFGAGFPIQLELREPGVFSAAVPPPGAYTLRVRCPGTVVQEMPVEIEASTSREIEVRLDRGLALAGVLVDDRGRPVPGQEIFVDRPWQEAGEHPPSGGRTTTDDEGRFRIAGLRAGPHSLGLVLARLVVPDGLRLDPPTEDLRVTVWRKAAVRVRLLVPAGTTPPEEVGIRVGRREGGGYGVSGHKLRWSGGDLVFRDLAPGESRVHFQAPGLLEVVRDLTLEPGETADLGTLSMEAGFDVEGYVVDRAGQPVAGAQVSAGEIWTALHRQVATEDDGRFVLRTLARGGNEIEITAGGFVPRTATLTAPSTGAPPTFTLDRGCALTVRVVDADGKPAPGVRLRWTRSADAADAADAENEAEVGDTDHRGILEIRLAEGTWELEALDAEYAPLLSQVVEVTEGGARRIGLTLPR